MQLDSHVLPLTSICAGIEHMYTASCTLPCHLRDTTSSQTIAQDEAARRICMGYGSATQPEGALQHHQPRRAINCLDTTAAGPCGHMITPGVCCGLAQ